MIDLTTYALLRKQIATAASGISDVQVEGNELVFVLVDGHEVRMTIPATEIRDAVVRDDVLVLTLADGKEVVVDATLTQSGQAADAKVTGDVVSQLNGDLAANSAADEYTRRKLDCLWKMNQGISYQFETDDTKAYSKAIPSGAKLASVEAVGGETLVWSMVANNWLGYSGSGRVEKTDGNVLAYTFINVLDNTYGNTMSSNVRVIKGHKYYQSFSFYCDKSCKISLGSVNDFWSYFEYSSTDSFKKCRIISAAASPVAVYIGVHNAKSAGFLPGDTFYVKDIIFTDMTAMFGSGNEPTEVSDPRLSLIEKYATEHPDYNAGELVTADVESVKYNDAVVAKIPEAVRNLPGYGWSSGDVYNSIERTDTGWQYVQRVGSRAHQEGDTVTDGVTTYYVLDTPVVTDITNLMNGLLDAIPVEAGGTLTFENAAKLPVPSSVEYAVKLSEVNQ